MRRENVPAHDEAAIIVHRARTMIGRRWNPFTFNCEHFVELALGREPKSHQVQMWVAIAAVVCGIYIASRSR